MYTELEAVKKKLKNPAFCELIASIWEKGLTVEDVVSGFKNTGTFPVDANKYKVSRLGKVKLKNYNLWKANSGPVDEDGLLLSQLKMKVTIQLWLTPQMLTAVSLTLPLFHL